MDLVARIQTLDEAVYIWHSANILGKDMSQTIFLPSKAK